MPGELSQGGHIPCPHLDSIAASPELPYPAAFLLARLSSSSSSFGGPPPSLPDLSCSVHAQFDASILLDPLLALTYMYLVLDVTAGSLKTGTVLRFSLVLSD